MSSTGVQNGLYYAFSRPTWVMGTFAIIVAMLTGHFGVAKALLSSSNLRVVSKACIICCVLEILIIEMLFCTNATPLGVQLTFSTCLLFGLGFMLCTIIPSLIIMTWIEFPLTRML